jgi:hypothetical protein
MLYRAESWPIKKTQDKKLQVAEMRKLRWMCEVTKYDTLRNEKIRGTTKVVTISQKIQEIDYSGMDMSCGEKRTI